MIAIQIILLVLTAVFCATAAFFMWECAKLADELKRSTLGLSGLKSRMDIFEADFSEKFDSFVKRLSSRQKMRQIREANEESEDSNTQPVLVPV